MVISWVRHYGLAHAANAPQGDGGGQCGVLDQPIEVANDFEGGCQAMRQMVYNSRYVSIELREIPMKTIVTVCTLCVLLNGCDTPSSNGRYQIAASGNGWLYRIDTQTGKVWQCFPEGCRIADPDPLTQ